MPSDQDSFRLPQNHPANDFLHELKQGFDLYIKAAIKPIPDVSKAPEATEASMRQSLLDQRACLIEIKSSLETINATSNHFLKTWREGKKPLTALFDWTRISIKIFDNLIEENLFVGKARPYRIFSGKT